MNGCSLLALKSSDSGSRPTPELSGANSDSNFLLLSTIYYLLSAKGSLYRLYNQLPCRVGVFPVVYFYPFARFKIFVMLKEMLDLIQRDLRQIAKVMNIFITSG